MKKQFSLSGKRKTKKEEKEKQEESQPEAIDLNELLSALEKPELRVTGVYGGVEEERCSETTYGIGKVMSAGVLMLAAGTKGERRIGKYCRVMIHGVVAGQHGHIADVENEFEETKHTQKMYIKALAEETNMTERYLKNLVSKKTNVYIDAEEAVNLGIADIIV